MFRIESGDGKFKIEVDEAPIVFYYALLLALKSIAEKKGYQDEENLIKLIALTLSNDGVANKAINSQEENNYVRKQLHL